MRNRNARKMWRIWQPCLYVYCVTLQNRIEDKYMNVLTFKLLDASLLLNYFEGFYFLVSKLIFSVIILHYFVSLQVIVLKSYIAPEQLQTSVFQNACSILLFFG